MSRLPFHKSLLPMMAVALVLSQGSNAQQPGDTLKYYLRNDTTQTTPPSPPPVATEEQSQEEDSLPVTDTVPINEFKRGWLSTTDSVAMRHLPDSLVQRLQKDKAFWYANYNFGPSRKEETGEDGESRSVSLFDGDWFQAFIWVVIILSFVAFIIFYLRSSNIRLFRSKPQAVNNGETGELDTGDIFGINYQAEINQAVAARNYRLAVRLMFLRLLRDMADKKIIEYKQEATNFDYLLQLQAAPFYPAFFTIVRHYEYTWYGLFDVDAAIYTAIDKEFIGFYQQMR